MNHDKVVKFVDGLHTNQKRKRHGVKKKSLIVVSVVLLITALTASAGMMTFFLKINTSIVVTETTLKVNGQNAPLTVSESFDSACNGDIFYTDYNLTNIRASCYFNVSFTTIADEGINITILNESNETIDWIIVGPLENVNVTVKWAVSLLAEPGTYSGNVTFVPTEAEFL